jgi:hypothetical protein
MWNVDAASNSRLKGGDAVLKTHLIVSTGDDKQQSSPCSTIIVAH